ncbi:hypothetical protein EXU48_13095 [Occultella glacieicola]|uniref:Uncharacterized protein n=1 Tax=Occultella glacieicola TaxID=2518684 RepID=A0ABY2E1M5_9MICO|nr:hypothetical protein [Occultella glacieicola]TDE92489.1 hypothetical protein EXU48_13095 [Occultella glacieicola]
MNLVLTIEIAAAALVISAGAGGPITAWILRLASRKRLEDAAERDGADPDDRQADPAAEQLRGGAWIGVLERLAITGSILVGYPAAIAVVVAVKGLGRFPEIHGSVGVSERFIIGTLASYLWAGAIGVAAVAALGALP